MRSNTRSTLRLASAVGAVALAGGSWLSAGTALAEGSSSSSSEQVTATVWWLLPEGTEHATASQVTQTRISAGAVPCGRTAQVDTYKGTQAELDGLGDTLTPGEDAQVYVDSYFFDAEACAPAPSEEPSATPSASPSDEPSQPAVTPSSPAGEPTPVNPSLPPTTEEPSATPSASPSDEPSQPAVTPSSTPSEPGGLGDGQLPESPALPQIEGQDEGNRPSLLPHTGDMADGLSPIGIGAGVCGIVFAAAFLGRRKH